MEKVAVYYLPIEDKGKRVYWRVSEKFYIEIMEKVKLSKEIVVGGND